MPPQSLSLIEHGTEGGVLTPQARNFAFLGHSSVKIPLLFFHFLFTRHLAQLSFDLFGEAQKGQKWLWEGAWP